jgi:FAD/FMN-containing dehydrogenase
MGAIACEALDRSFLDVARRGGAPVPVSAEAESVLLAEVEASTDEEATAIVHDIEVEFRAAGATEIILALDPATERSLWEIRHAASPILNRLDPSLTSMQLIEDGCVPPDRVPEYVRGVRAALARHETRGVIFGHAGDAHYHVNALVEVGRPEWRSRVDALLNEVTALIARLGGTVSGEHGDGRLRAPLLPLVWSPEAIAHFAVVKRAFAPAGSLNPGAKVASAGARAVTDVKYDPALPPLPEPARLVLVRVERERAYARSRIAMLDEVAARMDARAGDA